MDNKNDILKKYIIDKYGSVAKFIKKERFSSYHLETVFHKNDIFYEIGIAIKICAVLNIDAKMLFCHNEIIGRDSIDDFEDTPAENLSLSVYLDDIIKEKYAGLNKENRKKVLDYASYIFENGDGEI